MRLLKLSSLLEAKVYFTYTSVFQACSVLADCNIGGQVHGDTIKRSLVGSQYGESALITIYSKCRCLDGARAAFEAMDNPDIVAWTAYISGHAYYGNASEALRLFEEFDDFMEGNVFQCSMTKRREQLLDHSERLAIAYGLISVNGNARGPIKVFKNLRACPDCHEFAKHVSLVTGHGIIIQDSRRFHNF